MNTKTSGTKSNTETPEELIRLLNSELKNNSEQRTQKKLRIEGIQFEQPDLQTNVDEQTDSPWV